MSTAAATTSEWFTVTELARRWRVGESTVYRQLFVREQDDQEVPRGRVLAVKFAGTYRVHADVIEAIERAGKTIPAQPSQREAMKPIRVAQKRAAVLANVPNHLGDL